MSYGMDRDFDIIVVGAGPGGSTVASLLANDGKRVLLVDKNSKPGGKMLTIRSMGHTYEMFPMNAIPGYGRSLFEKLSERLHKTHLVKNAALEFPEDSTHIYYIDREERVIPLVFSNAKGMVKKLGIKGPVEAARVMWALARLLSMGERRISRLYNISAYDYIQRFRLPELVKTFLTASFGEDAFEMTSDQVPAAHMVKILQTGLRTGKPRYYNVGIGGFFEAMARTVTEKGGKWLMHTRVAFTDVEGGRAVGITTQTGEKYTAPVVVSSAGIRQTVLHLAGVEHFNKAYVEAVRGLKSNLACIGYRYFVAKPVLEVSTSIIYPQGCLEPWETFARMARGEKAPGRNYIYVGTKSVYPGISPEGKQVIYACMSCLPDPRQDFQPYLAYVEKRLQQVFPQLFDGRIEKREVMGLDEAIRLGVDSLPNGQGGESYGIANAMGQAGPKQPRMETPVKGLYIVGNDAGGFGLGTHQAVDSGFHLYGLLKKRGL